MRRIWGTGTLTPSLARLRALAAGAVLLVAPRSGDTQVPVRPFLDWRTVETEHFAFHFARELEEWTLGVAEQIESVRSTVGAIVGNVPRR